jgi:hypothetical protein
VDGVTTSLHRWQVTNVPPHHAGQSGDGGLVDIAACNFSFRSNHERRNFTGGTMPDIEYIRAEIERMRMQVHRQRGEIRQLQRAGISTTSAEALLERMLNNIDGLVLSATG